MFQMNKKVKLGMLSSFVDSTNLYTGCFSKVQTAMAATTDQ